MRSSCSVTWPSAARAPGERSPGPDVRDDDAIAQVELALVQDLPVPPLPGAILDVLPQAGQARRRVSKLGERRDGAADARVEVRAGTTPVRSEKSVGAIVGNRQPTNVHAAEDPPQLLHRRKDASVDRHDLGEVIFGEP